MTYCSSELLERGVPRWVVEWRLWRRREARITCADAACMLHVSLSWLAQIELGKQRGDAFRVRMERLRARWEPSMRPIREEHRGGWKKRVAA